MLHTINQKINRLNQKIGLNYTLPMPSRTMLEINQKVNVAVTIAALAVGVPTRSKILLGAGILSGLSAVCLHIEKKKL